MPSTDVLKLSWESSETETFKLQLTEIFAGGVRGNSIHGETGAVLSSDRVGGQFEDVRFSGDLELTGDRGRQFAGQIENSGTLTLLGSGERFGGIGVVGEVTLTGGGVLRLTGDAPALFEGFSQSFEDSQPQLINVDNTVSGHGSIDVFFDNQSVVRAEGGTLSLDSLFENFLGRVEIGFDGTLGGSLEGGTVVGERGSQVAAGLRNATLQGHNTVSEGAGLFLEGNINNESDLLVKGGLDLFSAQLSGPGTLLLDGGTVQILNDGFSDINHRLRGNGLVDGSITNRQGLYVDGGIFAVEQQLTASPLSQTDVLLDGDSFSLSGSITANEALLNGTLGLVVGESFSASIGDSFEIIDAASSVDGTFFSIDTSAAAGYEFQINYLADGVEIEVTDFLPILANIDGDFDQDGDVDADDIDFYSLNVDNEIARAENERLNLNLDGVVTLADHDILITQYAQTSNGEIGTFDGDFNLDGSVDVLGDAFILISNLGVEGVQFGFADGDSNADGRVDVLNDAFNLVENLGRSNSSGLFRASTSTIPEPNALLVLLIVGAAGVVRRSRCS